MEQAVVKEVLGVLHAQVGIVLIVQLDLAHRCLDVGDQVHKMALFQPGLVFHICANALHWSKVAQITVLSESGGKSAL